MDYFEFLSKFYDSKTISDLKESLNTKPIFSLRINPTKYPKSLDLSNLEKHPYVNNCYLFDKETSSYGKLIEHDNGCYYIQDPSAAMVVNILDIKENDLVFDMCAAPGGKITQASLLTNNSVYCNDISFSRSLDLLENIERLGLSNTIIFNEDSSKLSLKFQGLFDKVILDSPCSGEGMFRKNINMFNDWSIEKVNSLIPIQKQLIMNAYNLLKKGGIMTYSTCTFNKLEDEEIVQYLLDNTNASIIEIKDIDGVDYSSSLKGSIHIFPGHFKGEGHYIAKIQCNDDHQSNTTLLKTNIDNKSFNIYKRFEKECLDINLNKEDLYMIDNNLYKLPPDTYNIKDLNVLKIGLYMGEVKDNYFIPSHHLGSNTKVKWKNQIELDNNQVKDYIKGLSFKVSSTSSSYHQVLYNSNPLGICKIVNNTLKNLYPKKLRK